jgi:hypothetical protein
MTDYTKSTNFATKDSLSSGNALKILKGTELDTEFNNIATAIATKADLASPTFTGTPTLPTGTVGVTQSSTDNTTKIATTAFTQSAITQNATNVNISGGTINLATGTYKTTNWTWYESSGTLFFEYSGTKKMKIDSSGNITVVGNVTAYGTV